MRSRSSPLDHLGLRSHHSEGAAVEFSRLAHGLPNGEVDVRCPLHHFQHHHHDYARRHFWNPIERPYCSSMEGFTVAGFKLSNNGTPRRIRAMTLPRMDLFYCVSGWRAASIKDWQSSRSFEGSRDNVHMLF